VDRISGKPFRVDRDPKRIGGVLQGAVGRQVKWILGIEVADNSDSR